MRWNREGSMLVTAGAEGRVNVVDFATEKVYYTGSTPDGSNNAVFI